MINRKKLLTLSLDRAQDKLGSGQIETLFVLLVSVPIHSTVEIKYR